MSLYGMINVGVQFNLDKIKNNIDAFKALYGVDTEQEAYHRYLSDMSKHLIDAVSKVEGVSYESRLVGIQESDEVTEEPEHEDVALEEEAVVEPLNDDVQDEAYTDDDENVSEEVSSIIANIDKVGVEYGLVTKVVVNELNPRLKNFTKLIGVPVETAEMGEDYYLVYESYGYGEERHWNPEGKE